MAKIQKKDGSLVIKKNFWSAISIWWAIIVFLIAIPAVLFIGFVQLDYKPYMEGLSDFEPLVKYVEDIELAQEKEIDDRLVAYKEKRYLPVLAEEIVAVNADTVENSKKEINAKLTAFVNGYYKIPENKKLLVETAVLTLAGNLVGKDQAEVTEKVTTFATELKANYAYNVTAFNEEEINALAAELGIERNLEIEPTYEYYQEYLHQYDEVPAEEVKEVELYLGGKLPIQITAGFMVSKGMSVEKMETVRRVATVTALTVFSIALVYLIAKFICAKKTAWTFYDGAVIYKKGKIFYCEENTRDMEFFPGMSVSIRRTLKGKIFGYGDVIVSNGAGEAGEIILSGVKKPKKVQKALRELLAMACTRTANMMSPYKMYPQMYRHVLGGYPAYYYGAAAGQANQNKK